MSPIITDPTARTPRPSGYWGVVCLMTLGGETPGRDRKRLVVRLRGFLGRGRRIQAAQQPKQPNNQGVDFSATFQNHLAPAKFAQQTRAGAARFQGLLLRMVNLAACRNSPPGFYSRRVSWRVCYRV